MVCFSEQLQHYQNRLDCSQDSPPNGQTWSPELTFGLAILTFHIEFFCGGLKAQRPHIYQVPRNRGFSTISRNLENMRSLGPETPAERISLKVSMPISKTTLETKSEANPTLFGNVTTVLAIIPLVTYGDAVNRQQGIEFMNSRKTWNFMFGPWSKSM